MLNPEGLHGALGYSFGCSRAAGDMLVDLYWGNTVGESEFTESVNGV